MRRSSPSNPKGGTKVQRRRLRCAVCQCIKMWQESEAAADCLETLLSGKTTERDAGRDSTSLLF